MILIQPYNFLIISNILQNQYYEVNRFIIYRFQKKITLIYKVVCLTLTIILTLLNKYFCCLFLFYFLEPFNFKKNKFKFTNRVKRHLTIFVLLTLFNILFNGYIVLQIIFNLFLYWLSYLISYIVEKIITLYYIKKAKNKLKNIKPNIIAITGSYGKTSCKNYIYEFLKNDYNVLISPKSYNTLNGILLTINKLLKPYHNVLILELGVDKKNGMNKYLKLFSIDIALVTSIGPQHLKTFKSIDNIAFEKNKILNKAKEYSIVNLNNKYISCNLPEDKIITSSTNKNSDINIKIIDENIEKSKLEIKIFNEKYETFTSLLGKHNIENIACCIAVAKAMNVSNDSILKTTMHLKNVEHRLSKILYKNWTIIDDSYNSNYSGFLNAIELFNNIKNYKVIITPGIIESNNETFNKKIADKINTTFDLVILINNPTFKNLIKNYLSFSNFNEAYDYLKEKYIDKSLTILIENDLPDIFIR